MMSSKLYIQKYQIVFIIGLIFVLVLSLIIEQTLLRIFIFAIAFGIIYYLYRYFKQKELGYILDEREYKCYLEAFRYSSILLLVVFLALWTLNEVGKISSEFYLGFSLALSTFLITHLIIYRILLWLR